MQYDVIVIGGSYAGVAAAMQLARARRPILVIDAGQPRNRFADYAHGVLAMDGLPGNTILARAREQLRAYPSVRFMNERVASAQAGEGGFEVITDAGVRFSGRRLILATGVTDQLPTLPGLAERWGKTVLHCPYCHGYELDQGHIGVLAAIPMSVHQASLIADWGHVTLFTDEKITLDDAALTLLARRQVTVETVPVVAIEGSMPAIDMMRLADGRAVPLRALFVAAPTVQTSPLAAQLGCTFDDTLMGPIVRTDLWKLSTVPGVYAAGDAARAPHNITFAMADGVSAGVGAHQSLIAEEAGQH